MKRFVFLAVFCSSVAAAADSLVSFALHEVTISDLVRVVLDDVAGASVVIEADILEDRKPVTFALKRLPVRQAVAQLSAVLESRGYQLDQAAGVYRVRRVKEVAEEILVYLPRFRSVAYLADLVGGLVGHGAITTQRTVAAPAGQVQAPQQGAPTSALGMIDKSDKDALILKAKPEVLAQARRVLEQVDTPIPELLVKAVVMEVQTGAVEGSAVNLLASILTKGIGVGITVNGGADKGNAITLKVDKLDAVWSAISTDNRFKVVSAPQVRVKSGGSARFAVGADVPILGAVNYQGNGQSVQSVVYKPSGVILELRPEIRGELAELKIEQQLSSFAKTETGVNNSPTLMKRELSTSVIVGGRDVVLLGGLDEDRTSSDDSGLFFLPSWMRSYGSQKSRSEIVLMLYVERVKAPGEPI